MYGILEWTRGSLYTWGGKVRGRCTVYELCAYIAAAGERRRVQVVRREGGVLVVREVAQGGTAIPT